MYVCIIYLFLTLTSGNRCSKCSSKCRYTVVDSLLSGARQKRSISSPASMDRHPGPWTSTPRSMNHRANLDVSSTATSPTIHVEEPNGSHCDDFGGNRLTFGSPSRDCPTENHRARRPRRHEDLFLRTCWPGHTGRRPSSRSASRSPHAAEQ